MPGERTSLRELAQIFLRLGTTSFGGPAAHIANMHDEFVRKRKWLKPVEFLDLLGVTNLIPGPNSTEMAIHIGHVRAGVPGLIVSGVCFILPAAVMVTVIAWLYVMSGVLPKTDGIFYAIKPVVIAVILQAVLDLGRSAIQTKFLAVVAVAAAVLNLFGVGELPILFGAALIAFGVHRGRALGAFFLLQSNNAALWPLFTYFLKVGSVLFGSGYLLVAFMQADLVERLGWLTEQQLLDAIAVGQLTPGPLFTAATFAGYLILGFPGAILATVGIFLPAFVFVALTHPFIRRLREIESAKSILNGINAAAVALMFVVPWQLGRAAIVDYTTAGLALVSGLLLARFRMNSAWLVLGAALVGLLIRGQ
jgi:chromate transporter